MRYSIIVLAGSLLLITHTKAAEAVQAGKAATAFASTAAGGNWSSLATWKTQDGRAPERTPGEGDTVLIAGSVTVDAPVAVGTGTGDAIVLARSATMGEKKLIVTAPLTVKGNVRFEKGSVVDVRAGAGIELDGASGVAPKIYATYDNSIHL